MRCIILSGAPGSGKTSVAQRLAKKLDTFQCFGTDIIREVARTFLPKVYYPWLHESALLAGKYAPKDADSVVWGYENQSSIVAPSINSILKRFNFEGQDCIIEGANLLRFLAKTPKYPKQLRIVLTIPDTKVYLKRLKNQSSRRSNYKVNNFQKILHYQDYLVQKAQKNDILVLNNVSVDETVQCILSLIKKL
jgi:2-phosphoglycerate kinase